LLNKDYLSWSRRTYKKRGKVQTDCTSQKEQKVSIARKRVDDKPNEAEERYWKDEGFLRDGEKGYLTSI